MRAASLALSLLIAAGVGCDSAFALPDPTALYGHKIVFDVERKGAVIGRHTVHFERTDAGLTSRSEVEMAVNLLFFRAFHYRYRADAHWRGGTLHFLAVDIDDNGRRSQLRARGEGDRLVISAGAGAFDAEPGLYPTEHWDAGILSRERLLNTLTGKINRVDIQRAGHEFVETERGPIAATRYHYTGDFAAEVWYDDAGRWVKLRFKGRDGSTITYRCRLCQGGEPK